MSDSSPGDTGQPEAAPGLPPALEVVLVAAAASNGTIGREGDLPWRLPRDLKRFKALTKGHPMIMGRKTWESIGKRPLPGRPTVVVTRQGDYELPTGVVSASDLPQALALAAELGPGPVFVAGGEGIYRAALPLATGVELTRVHAEVEGDARFPLEALDGPCWERVSAEPHAADERHAHAFTFEVWRPRLDVEGRALVAYAAATPPADELREWGLGLERWGDEACVVAALSAGRYLRTRRDRSEDTPTVEALAASEFLLAHPSTLAEQRAREAWGRETGWAMQIEWAELAAEVLHRAGWIGGGTDACFGPIRTALIRWAERRHSALPLEERA